MSRRTIAQAERSLIDVQNHQGTRRWQIAVRTPALPREERDGHFFLAKRGEDTTKPETERVWCSKRYARAKAKARKLGLKVHSVLAAK